MLKGQLISLQLKCPDLCLALQCWLCQSNPYLGSNVFFYLLEDFLVSDEIKLPSFEWITLNLESPSMKINFPDGGNPDVVNLEREDDGPHDGHQDHEDDTCNYSGHLLQEPGDLKRTNLFIGM